MGWNNTPATPLDDLDDDQLVAMVQEDKSAFETLYRRYVQRIYRYCLKRTNNVQIAEDLCSDIFLRVLEKLDTYHPNGNFAGWLFRVAHNAIVDHYRRQKEVINIEHLQMKGETHMSKIVANQLLVSEILSELTDDERQLIVLRLEAELSAPEIAERTGQTANAVRVQIYRLMKRLRARYSNMLGDAS
ncbi:MAG: sigma-70 family RNA polymerase sigma factor [Chloroflexota bacterium]